MATTYTVSTAAELKDALARAGGGDTILLDEGDYGQLTLNGYTSAVTLKSADPAHPASFSSMDLDNSANLTFDGITFDYSYASSDQLWSRPFEISNCNNITITNSTFDGDLASNRSAVDDGHGFAIAFSANGCSDLAITNTEFYNFHRGTVISQSQGVSLVGNEMHSLRSDGMDFAEVRDVLIEDNHLHDFRGSPASGDHGDFIQFWTSGTDSPSSDITIRGNTLDIGAGTYTQSIFIRNEMVDTGAAGEEMFYQNILIEDNTIYNDHLHGISVGETAGLTIRNNSVLHANGDPIDDLAGGLSIPAINLAANSTGVTVTENLTGGVSGYSGQTGWVVSDNLHVQDTNPDAPNYYGTVFVTSSMSAVDGRHHFVILPGHPAETAGIGSSATLFDDAPDELSPLFNIRSSANATGEVFIFDARLTADLTGLLDASDARYHWEFGDGTTADGIIVEHRFAEGGSYTATLSVIQPNGPSASTTDIVEYRGADLLSFDATQGGFLVEGYGSDTLVGISAAALAGSSGHFGLNLGGTGTAASVASSNLMPLFQTDNFEISFNLQADQGTSSHGEIFRLHNSFIASVDASGALSFQVFTEDGKFTTVTSSGVSLLDGEAHAVAIDLEDGQLTLTVDGKVSGVQAVTAETNPLGYWDLDFGNPWGSKNFEGTLTGFDINATKAGYPVFSEGLLEDHTSNVPRDAEHSGGTPMDGTPLTLPDFDYALDIGALGTQAPAAGPQSVLVGNAHVVQHAGNTVIAMDGDHAQVKLGRLAQFETSDQLTFSVDFQRNTADGGIEGLVRNPYQVRLTLQDDGIALNVATAGGSMKTYRVDDLGLNDTDLHRAVVMIDERADRLQVFVDDRLVLHDTSTDFDLDSLGQGEKGWRLGSHYNTLDGEISDFRITDTVAFVDHAPVGQAVTLLP